MRDVGVLCDFRLMFDWGVGPESGVHRFCGLRMSLGSRWLPLNQPGLWDPKPIAQQEWSCWGELGNTPRMIKSSRLKGFEGNSFFRFH